LPVKEIDSMARARGVDAIVDVDAAQSITHMDFTMPDIGADINGLSLCQRLNAPIGTAGIWIRGAWLTDFGARVWRKMLPEDDTRSRTNVWDRDVSSGRRKLPAARRPQYIFMRATHHTASGWYYFVDARPFVLQIRLPLVRVRL
jgi:selenocysteine lyase/cysteine desulfurase